MKSKVDGSERKKQVREQEMNENVQTRKGRLTD
jgi:hypothetical protein